MSVLLLHQNNIYVIALHHLDIFICNIQFNITVIW